MCALCSGRYLFFHWFYIFNSPVLATAPAMGMTMVMVMEKIMVMVMEMGIEGKEQAKTTATAMVIVMDTVQLLRRMKDGELLSTCKAASASQRWLKSSTFTYTRFLKSHN